MTAPPCVLLMSASEAAKRGLTPLARIASWATAGVDPADHGHRARSRPRGRRCKKAGWKVADLDLVEANEAFAAQACAVNKDMGWNPDIVNVNGGAIAIGHPIGASGARVLNTLLYRDEAPQCQEGPCHAVHRRRHGRRHVRRTLTPELRRGHVKWARVAVVTGGSRGIGAAISKALKAAGYKVAANYAGNDEAAAKPSRPKPAFRSTNGMSRTTRPAPPASSRSRPISARSTSWSTMPASPATPCSTR